MIRDYAWATLAVAIAGLAALNLTACVFFLLRGELSVLLGAPISLLFAYWIGIGAWRRTAWGRPAAADVFVGPPELSDTRARQLILLAAACGVTLALALALQVVVGRS